MILSYTLRLLCLLLIVSGLLHLALQLGLARNARSILRRLKAAPARRQERVLYLLQTGPPLASTFIAAALCIPGYLRYEPHQAAEGVGWLCLLAAGVVGLWFGSGLLRGLRITLRTLHFTRTCRRRGQLLPTPGSGTPLLTVTDPDCPLGLIGFLRPLILISQDLVQPGGLHPRALPVALDHERSHALHFDNWKLLSLSFLPRLPADPWQQPWQAASDWAADDDAVRGDPARSLLLAEALVRAARSVRPSRASVIRTALTTAEAGLAARIDRLIHPRHASPAAGNSPLPALAALALITVGAAAAASPCIYGLSEALLHLGSL